jgi:GTP cyclohydrolase III
MKLCRKKGSTARTSLTEMNKGVAQDPNRKDTKDTAAASQPEKRAAALAAIDIVALS